MYDPANPMQPTGGSCGHGPFGPPKPTPIYPDILRTRFDDDYPIRIGRSTPIGSGPTPFGGWPADREPSKE